MSAYTLRLDEFPRNGRPWRIDGLGRIAYSATSTSEPLIATHLSELSNDKVDPLMNGNPTGRGYVAFVKIGQIALLKLGSVWVDGIRMPVKSSATHTFSFDPAEFTLHRLDDTVEICGVELQPLAASRFHVSPDSAEGLASSWVAIAAPRDSAMFFVAIPSAVLFQQCVATSAYAVRRLVWGEPDRILDNAHTPNDEPNSFYVEVCRDVKDTEVIAHASLRADEVGRREYARFRNALVVGSVNVGNGANANLADTYIRFGIPFTNRVTMTARGKRIKVQPAKGDDRWGFMVTEIDTMSVKLVFDRLYAPRKNDGRQGANSDDEHLEEAWPGTGQRPVKVGDADEIHLHSGEDPLRALEALCIGASGGFEAVGLDIVKEPKLLQKFSKAKGHSEEVEFDADFSTGDPHGGRAGSAELSIEIEPSSALPLTLTHFFSTLDELRRAGHCFTTVAVAENHRENETGDIVNFYPRKIRGLRSWHHMSKDPRAPTRGYVVAAIQTGGTHHYLLELERKGVTPHGLKHLRRFDGAPIDPILIRAYMIRVAVANSWTTADGRPGWVFETINHKASTETELFAVAIAKSLGLAYSSERSRSRTNGSREVAPPTRPTGGTVGTPNDAKDRVNPKQDTSLED